MIHRLTRIATCVLLPVLLLGARPMLCHAAPRVAESPERREAARFFRRGKALYAAGEFEGALESFRSGFATYPLRGFLVNIAQCHRRLGQLDEAIVAYRKFLDGPDVAPTLQREVEEALAEVERVRRATTGAEPAEVAAPSNPPAPAADAPVSDDEVPPGVQLATQDPIVVERRAATPERKRSRPWVWALVGVGAAVVVAGVTVGVVLGVRSSDPGSGSLGLLDGRTR